ncbi:MAG: superoxide dismutase family protein [Bacillota bacterium]|nr:superoxide dismutase family protein [Bacillota bacterium]
MYKSRDEAVAYIKGGSEYPDIHGNVYFYQTNIGIIVSAEIYGLPVQNDCSGSSVFGFHIHEGSECTGNSMDEFADTLGHYNPKECPHPYHAGDLPPLFADNGYAYMSVLTSRFKLNEIIGKTVIIHEKPDDFTTQPSGNSGKKIACGKIEG